MFFAMVVVLVVIMVRPFLPASAPPPEPLRVNIGQLQVGGMQGIGWNRQRLLIVRSAIDSYLVIADYDPIFGCPLQWIGPGAVEAPSQPWPGGLRAICTEHWFDSRGTSLTQGVADLRRFSYTQQDAKTLVISAESH